MWTDAAAFEHFSMDPDGKDFCICFKPVNGKTVDDLDWVTGDKINAGAKICYTLQKDTGQKLVL